MSVKRQKAADPASEHDSYSRVDERGCGITKKKVSVRNKLKLSTSNPAENWFDSGSAEHPTNHLMFKILF
jgi:hypothetical protein